MDREAENWKNLGAKLREARRAAGLRQEDAARLLEISRPSLSAMEAGKTRVSTLTLDRMAKLYRQETSYFFGEPSGGSELDQQVFERLGQTSDEDRKKISRFLEFCEDLGALRSMLRHPKKELPAAYPVSSRTRSYRVGVEAKRERARFGLGDAPIGERLYGLLDMVGLPVYRASLESPNISGLLVSHPEADHVMFVNSAQYRWRQVFTAAHEYAHLLFDRSVQPVACRIFSPKAQDASEGEESFMNAFASEFLMPQEGIVNLLVTMGAASDRIQAEDVVHLQRHFGVSFQAMLHRLHHLRLLPRDQMERMKAEVRPVHLAARMGYSVDPDEFGEKRESSLDDKYPSSYIQMVLEAFEQDLISSGRAAEMLGLDLWAFDRFYRRRSDVGHSREPDEELEHVVG